MPSAWTKEECEYHYKILHSLYVAENLSLGQISKKMKMSDDGVYKRLMRLGIPIQRHLKKGYNNTTRRVTIPDTCTEDIAEFLGIMMGDGHISPTQVIVTLGTKEVGYVSYVAKLMSKIFLTKPVIFMRKVEAYNNRYRTVYFGSVATVSWLKKQGLVHNKVKSQVDVPSWIFINKKYMARFLRGFFDTDGSVYKLKFGIQISFSNKSFPILFSLQKMLKRLEYKVSNVSSFRVYLTRRKDVIRFFQEIRPANKKHLDRFNKFCVGTEVDKRDAL